MCVTSENYNGFPVFKLRLPQLANQRVLQGYSVQVRRGFVANALQQRVCSNNAPEHLCRMDRRLNCTPAEEQVTSRQTIGWRHKLQTSSMSSTPPRASCSFAFNLSSESPTYLPMRSLAVHCTISFLAVMPSACLQTAISTQPTRALHALRTEARPSALPLSSCPCLDCPKTANAQCWGCAPAKR